MQPELNYSYEMSFQKGQLAYWISRIEHADEAP